MIEFLNSWVKGIGVTIVIITILEMLLPNNKTKKYIQMLFGIFVIFNIVAPIVQNKGIFKLENFEFDKYETVETVSQASNVSMDERISKLYEEELKENIKNNLKQKGYEVENCNIRAKMKKDTEYEIEKITLKINKLQTDKNNLVKKIEINTKDEKEASLSEAEIKNVKKILIEEYGVMEKCLEIN